MKCVKVCVIYLLWSYNSNRIEGLREYFHEDEIILIRSSCFGMEPCEFIEIPETLFMTTLQEQNQEASPFHVEFPSVCAKSANTAVS